MSISVSQKVDLLISAISNDATLTIVVLKDIMRMANISPLSGRKGDLINRIVNALCKCRVTNDRAAVELIEKAFLTVVSNANLPTTTRRKTGYIPSGQIVQPTMPDPNAINIAHHNRIMTPSDITFAKSVFYYPVETLTNASYCPATFNSRNSVIATAKLKPQHLEYIRSKKYSVRIFCCTSNCISNDKPSLVEFPTLCELKVNGKSVSANLRGIKNLRGSANPADITSYLMQNSLCLQRIEFIYMNTVSSFSFIMKLVRETQISDVLKILLGRPSIAPEFCNQPNESNEDDVVATATSVTLKDPLTFTRIKVPIRSRDCKHLQCFDAESFLTMTKQLPSWRCPCCNVILNFDAISVDSFFQAILEKTKEEDEIIIIQPTGEWSNGSVAGDEASVSSNDDDIINNEPQYRHQVAETTTAVTASMNQEPQANDGISLNDAVQEFLNGLVLPQRPILNEPGGSQVLTENEANQELFQEQITNNTIEKSQAYKDSSPQALRELLQSIQYNSSYNEPSLGFESPGSNTSCSSAFRRDAPTDANCDPNYNSLLPNKRQKQTSSYLPDVIDLTED